MSLVFSLKADNSSGIQLLHFDKMENGYIRLTLTGNLNGGDIQVDFEPLDKGEFEMLMEAFQMFYHKGKP